MDPLLEDFMFATIYKQSGGDKSGAIGLVIVVVMFYAFVCSCLGAMILVGIIKMLA